MKPISRLIMAGVGLAVAGVLAAASPAAAAPAPAEVGASAWSCSASANGSTVTGNCTLDTFLGRFGATFSGNLRTDGYGSGTIVLQAGFLGTRTGSWSGGPFLRGATATVDYSVPTPLGPINGQFTVPIP